MSTATDTAATILKTALDTAALIATTDPRAAAAVALAPIFTQLLNAAMQMQQARAMTPEALASLFVSIGKGIQSTSNEWNAMNKKQ